MKKIMKQSLMVLFASLAVAMTSCTKDEMPNGQTAAPVGDKITVTAYVSNDETKVTSTFNQAESKYSFAWNEGVDKFSVIGNDENQTFTNVSGNNFTGTEPADAVEGVYYAIHPVSTAVDHTAATFDISDQTEDAAYVLYSSTNDVNTFKFKHAMAYLRLSLPAELNGETCDITIITPTGVFTDGKINLENGTLDYTNSTMNYISLTRQVDNSNPILVSIPPMVASNKTLLFQVFGNGKYYEGTLNGTDGKAIQAGKYYSADIDLQESIIPYVTFTAEGEQTLKYVFYQNSGKYQGEDLDTDLEWTDGRNNWTVLGEDEVSFGGVTKVYVRARTVNADGTAAMVDSSTGDPTVWGQFVFRHVNVGVECSGDIRTLINRDYKNVETNKAKFKKLFSGCKSLKTAPALPATTLAASCYYGMFEKCTKLTTAPALPATTLATSCYNQMFWGCTSLTTAPSLPATTLATSCYFNMFNGCAKLTEAPELPATTLAASCYEQMFSQCTSLTTAPSLPATTLAEKCYSSMFNGCTGLQTAPELPATTLHTRCYNGMFSGCTGLQTAPELPATTLADNCYFSMFNRCSGLQTAPELPATTLADYCYQQMFMLCTGLQTAPELPATTLATSCYNQMFRQCTSLTTAPALPATTLAESCYNGMFMSCTGLQTAPELLATTLATSCYNQMFRQCTSLTTAPVLPATTLAESCYNEMFMDCTNLNNIEMLATDISASNCLNNWVSGVASTGTFIKAASMESLPIDSASGIPSGWTVNDYAPSEH